MNLFTNVSFTRLKHGPVWAVKGCKAEGRGSDHLLCTVSFFGLQHGQVAGSAGCTPCSYLTLYKYIFSCFRLQHGQVRAVQGVHHAAT